MKGKFRPKSKTKGNAVLNKYRTAVEDFVKTKSGSDDVDHERGFKFVKKKSRKELRKEKRKLKKAKMKSHYEGKKDHTPPTADEERPNKQQTVQKKKKKDAQSNDLLDTKKKTTPKSKPQHPKGDKKINKLQESRKMALLEANEQEDREIKKLERSLGLNKRKNKKTIPQSFVADGLDYILGVLDSGSSAMAMYDSEDDKDMAKDSFSKLDANDESCASDDDDDDEEQEEMESDEEEVNVSLDDSTSDEEMVDEEKAVEGSEDDQYELNESDGQDEDLEEDKDEDMGSEGEDEDDATNVQIPENAEVVSPETICELRL